MLRFDNSVNIGNLIQLILVTIAIVGIYFTYYQIRIGNKTHRATFYKDIYTTLFSDKDIRNIYYKIEYEKFIYDENFHCSEIEKQLDRLLSFVDLICDFYAQKIINTQDMVSFQYELKRIYLNNNIKAYLIFIREYYIENGVESEPFRHFLSYCRKTFKNQ